MRATRVLTGSVLPKMLASSSNISTHKFKSDRALVRWFKIIQRHDFTSFETLRATFPTADKVGDFIVFNIGGNKYRLITAIHFNRRKVYIRHVLTHPEYDRGAWKP